MKSVIETYKEMEDSLASTVKISHSEVCRLVVIDLIKKRKFCVERMCSSKTIDAFETVLRYYLTEDEYDKYVIMGESIE